MRGRKTKLFDLSSDPGEQRDVSSEHPERFQELRGWIEKREEIDRHRRRLALRGSQPGEASEEGLSEDAKKALRELGYIQ